MAVRVPTRRAAERSGPTCGPPPSLTWIIYRASTAAPPLVVQHELVAAKHFRGDAAYRSTVAARRAARDSRRDAARAKAAEPHAEEHPCLLINTPVSRGPVVM